MGFANDLCSDRSRIAINIALNILGGIVSAIIFTIILNLWHRPRLVFISESLASATSDDKHFYHIFVNNRGHSTAYNCKVDIEFRNRHADTLILIRNGKWVENPEPVTIHLLTHPMNPSKYKIEKIPDISLLKYTRYTNIPPNSSQAFVLLLKYKGETNCYAFNGENYIEGFENKTDLKIESRRLAIGEYVAKITACGDNVSHSGEYYIYNNGLEFSDFTISPY